MKYFSQIKYHMVPQQQLLYDIVSYCFMKKSIEQDYMIQTLAHRSIAIHLRRD